MSLELILSTKIPDEWENLLYSSSLVRTKLRENTGVAQGGGGGHKGAKPPCWSASKKKWGKNAKEYSELVYATT